MTAHITLVFVIIDKVIHPGFTVKWLTFLGGKQSIKIRSVLDVLDISLSRSHFFYNGDEENDV